VTPLKAPLLRPKRAIWTEPFNRTPTFAETAAFLCSYQLIILKPVFVVISSKQRGKQGCKELKELRLDADVEKGRNTSMKRRSSN
jgi:hypothetical protein